MNQWAGPLAVRILKDNSVDVLLTCDIYLGTPSILEAIGVKID